MIRTVVPAFIDPPYGGDLAEWIEYREDLRRSNLPGLEPFIHETDRVIARLSHPDK
jgi:hypothetical protein